MIVSHFEDGSWEPNASENNVKMPAVKGKSTIQQVKMATALLALHKWSSTWLLTKHVNVQRPCGTWFP